MHKGNDLWNGKIQGDLKNINLILQFMKNSRERKKSICNF